MQPVLFQLNGLLNLGRYVPGQYAWPYDVTFTGASLRVRPPTDGVVVIGAEVDGELTGDEFTLAAAAPDLGALTTAEVKQELALSLLLKAGSVLRWVVVAAPDAAVTAAAASLTMQPVAASTSQASVPTPALTVNYVSGGGSPGFKVFDYNPNLHAFTPTADAAGLVTITDDGSQLVVTLGGDPVLQVTGGTIYCNEFFALGYTATGETPRLEFLINGTRVATLGLSGTLKVSDIDEATPAALAPTDPGFNARFEFWSEGELTATLQALGGLTALNVEEPTL